MIQISCTNVMVFIIFLQAGQKAGFFSFLPPNTLLVTEVRAENEELDLGLANYSCGPSP